MNLDKKVSILIPVYNRQDLIEDTVKCALAQTYTNTEIIIVDNHSTDNTWQIVQKLSTLDPRIKIFQNPTNIGPIRNWQRCLNEATGEYAKILFSDDIIHSTFLERTVPYLQDPEVGFVQTKASVIALPANTESPIKEIADTGKYSGDFYVTGLLFRRYFNVSPSCALFRTEDLKKNMLDNFPNKIGNRPDQHAIGPDALIYLLTANSYPYFYFINEPLAAYKSHQDSITVYSSWGKLLLHYALANSFFVENYRKDLIHQQNTINKLYLLAYKTEAKTYGLCQMSDFYMQNQDFSVDTSFLIKKGIPFLTMRCLSFIKQSIKKLIRRK